MAGMGALLNANLLSQKSKDMRSIIDNLSFIMEDMSRNLRTGYDYHCFAIRETIPPYPTTISPKDCGSGGGISLTSTNPISQWVYYTDNNPIDLAKYSIFKRVNGETVQLTPNEIKIDSLSFLVSGAERENPSQQPFVTIKLVGEIKYKDVTSPFSLQTSVSQRKLDF